MERNLQHSENREPKWIGKSSWIPALKKIRWIITDVDGVLTNGGIILDGEAGETKMFSVRDGVGVWLGHEAGLQFAILTGRLTPVVKRRAKELGIQYIYGRAINKKRDGLLALRTQLGLVQDEILYIGDDLIDIPVFAEVGLSVAPEDADAFALDKVSAVTRACGGRGVLREVVEAVLKAQGVWEEILKTRFGIGD